MPTCALCKHTSLGEKPCQLRRQDGFALLHGIPTSPTRGWVQLPVLPWLPIPEGQAPHKALPTDSGCTEQVLLGAPRDLLHVPHPPRVSLSLSWLAARAHVTLLCAPQPRANQSHELLLQLRQGLTWETHFFSFFTLTELLNRSQIFYGPSLAQSIFF